MFKFEARKGFLFNGNLSVDYVNTSKSKTTLLFYFKL